MSDQITFLSPTPRQGQRAPLAGVAAELYDLVTTVMPIIADNSARSQQVTLGPSELGIECDLRLVYSMLGWEEFAEPGDPLPSIIGTAAHTWMATAFQMADSMMGGGNFLVEDEVTLPGTNLTGHVDFVWRRHKVCVDWKFPGATGHKRYREEGPSRQYREQVHLYAWAKRAAGEDIEHVAIVFFSRGGWLSGTHVWSEPYDESIALAVMERVNRLAVSAATEGADNLDQYDRETSNCGWCPFYVPGSEDLTKGCPGTPREVVIQASE